MNAAETVGSLLRTVAEELRQAGLESADHEAKLLLSHVLDLPLGRLTLSRELPVEPEPARLLAHLTGLRAARVPLQYVTHTAYFCGLELRSDDRALIPRPETEILAETMAEELRLLQPTGLVVDVGCGSGAISLALAAMLPDWSILATDISAAALSLAQENAERLALTDRIMFAEGSMLEPVFASGRAAAVTAVVCNPPYVRPDELPDCEPEIHQEPRIAVQSPSADGLESYRQLADQAQRLPNLRVLGVELGYDQARDVAHIMAPLGRVQIVRDYTHFERIVLVHRDEAQP